MLTDKKYCIALNLNDKIYITNDTILYCDNHFYNSYDKVDNITMYIINYVKACEFGVPKDSDRSDIYIRHSITFKTFLEEVIDKNPDTPIYLVDTDATEIPILVLDLWSCAYNRKIID